MRALRGHKIVGNPSNYAVIYVDQLLAFREKD